MLKIYFLHTFIVVKVFNDLLSSILGINLKNFTFTLKHNALSISTFSDHLLPETWLSLRYLLHVEIVNRDLKWAWVVIVTRFRSSLAHRSSNKKAEELETPNTCKDTPPNRGRATFFLIMLFSVNGLNPGVTCNIVVWSSGLNAVFVAKKMCCVLNNIPVILALVTCEILCGHCLSGGFGYAMQQSLSIKEETQNRSLYSCVVLMSRNHACQNFN